MKPGDFSAIRYLRRHDVCIGEVISTVGLCKLRRSGANFELLAPTILSQQISVAAARTIRRRLKAAMPTQRLSAVGIIGLSESELAAVGV